jgi:25S rRNA (uracil2634-N3)-methyltransferase
MEFYKRHDLDENLAELAWKSFWLSALELKRVLDEHAPFDFAAKVKSGRVLLVGEGNLSFSLALARLAGTPAGNMTSTTFQSANDYSEAVRKNALKLQNRGVNVMSGVDATKLSKWFGRAKFDLVVFQFPNIGSRLPLYGRNPNHVLVRRFLRSARITLAREAR